METINCDGNLASEKRSLWRGNIGVMMLTSGIWTFGGQMT